MSFDWKSYLLLSEELIKRSEEACLRSSISRAYYGVFCIARNKKGYKLHKGSNIHSKIIDEYKEDKTLQKVGWNLDELRRARNCADYDDSREIKKSMAESMLLLAKQVLKDLESI
ncbi:MAG: HEPN domain-containing protein [Candidatus Desantisbacteria bacterium]